MTLERLAPMLLARNLQETIAFYTTVLGFTLEATFGDPPTWCSVSRDGVHLMFVWDPPHDHAPGDEHEHPDPSLTGALYIYADDVVSLHAAVDGRAEVCEPLGVRPHGMREFAVLDPSGYRLRF